MYINDPQIMNKDTNANQPNFFDKTISENQFNFSLEDTFIKGKTRKTKIIDEDDRFFGTHINEAKKTLKKIFKK